MEAEWIAKRATLRWLLHTHPEWTQKAYAAFLHCSVGWVKKWKKRLVEAAPDDLSVLHARSRARHTPFPAPHPAVVERIVQIRQAPPENLQRVPVPLERFIAWMREQAIAEERRGKFQTRAFGWRQLLLWDDTSA